jgi:16S rRNA (uracil1498-N3)-methyltransferase
MQFTYHINSGNDTLIIDGDLHKYLFKVRRHDKNINIYFRNLKDSYIYEYKISSIEKKQTILSLVNSEQKIISSSLKLHIGWCIIDPKNIEKQIASLNELGVDKVTFIYCQYSQKKYKINFDKLDKLLINSSQQSGRSDIIKIDICDSFQNFLSLCPNSYLFNFSSNHIDTKKSDIQTIILGCEGGFSDNEISLINKENIIGINSNIILKSETASITIASKILV